MSLEEIYKHVSKKYKGGKCYQNAVYYMYDHLDDPDFRVVHGWVTGRGEIEGIRYSHAWIEHEGTGMCIDPSLHPESPLIMPRLAYYHMGKIDPERILKYTADEMNEWSVKTGKFGPWETTFDEFS